MKMKYISFMIVISLNIFHFLVSSQVLGQNKVNLTAGLGTPELLNIGIRYQLNQKQIGFSIGTLPAKGETYVSVSGDFYYHFSESSELSDRRLWYLRTGLNYYHNEQTILLQDYLSIYVRFGRDFNLSEKVGIAVDVGLTYQLWENIQIDSGPLSISISSEPNFPIIAFGVGFFYQI